MTYYKLLFQTNQGKISFKTIKTEQASEGYVTSERLTISKLLTVRPFPTVHAKVLQQRESSLSYHRWIHIPD